MPHAYPCQRLPVEQDHSNLAFLHGIVGEVVEVRGLLDALVAAPVPESVLLDMAKHPIGHRSSEFAKILESVYADLKYVFQTKNDVIVYTASGTGAMDAALSNLVNPGDKVFAGTELTLQVQAKSAFDDYYLPYIYLYVCQTIPSRLLPPCSK